MMSAAIVPTPSPLRLAAERVEEIFPSRVIEMINPLIYTNADDFHNAAFQSWLLRSNAPRRANVEAVTLYRYSPGTLVDRDGSYITYSSGKLIQEQIPPWQGACQDLLQGLTRRRAGAICVRAPCMLVARYGATTWGHWLCELLPKAVIAESVYPHRFSYVVPSQVVARSPNLRGEYALAVLGSLAAYGIDESRLVPLPNDRALSFECLFDIDKISSDGIHPEVISTMQSNARICSSPRMPRRAVLLRRDTESRSVSNRTDLIELASHRGYHTIDLLSLAFGQQLVLFSGADSIIASLGSGLAGTIFAPDELNILTVAPNNWRDGYFINILSRKKAFHADIRGYSARTYKGDEGLSPFHVELKHVNAGLDALLAHSGAPRGSMVVLGGKCFPRSLGKKVFETNFGSRADPRYNVSGWSGPEETHTWSLGPTSTLLLHDCVLSAKAHWLEVRGISFVESTYLPVKPFCVAVNSHQLEIEIIAGDAHVFWLVPAEAIARDHFVRLEFAHPICPSPLSFGNCADARPLGFGFIRLAWYETD